jgi:hypothetical protein
MRDKKRREKKDFQIKRVKKKEKEKSKWGIDENQRAQRFAFFFGKQSEYQDGLTSGKVV